jgi:hypothetical protein
MNASFDDALIEAWERYCDTLKTAGRHILRDSAPPTPVDRAEGFRYLARLTAMGIDQSFENRPDTPILWRALGTHRKMYGDNPDALYSACPVDGTATYRVSGSLGSAPMVVFALMRRPEAIGQGQSMFTGHVYGHQLEAAADGGFELWLGPKRRDGNWLQLTPDTARLIIRQACGDWSREAPGRMIIERMDETVVRPPALSPEDVIQALENALQFPSLIPMWANEADATKVRTNRFFLDDHEHQKSLGGVPGGEAVLSYFRLEPREALVIEVTPPDCLYWNIQIGNYWYESFDYRNHLSSVNGAQAEREDDGTIRIVVAHEDPGVPNWLDTAGHQEGHLAIRWVEADHLPVPRTEVVDLAAWRDALPAAAKRFSPGERPAQIAARRRSVDWRFVA